MTQVLKYGQRLRPSGPRRPPRRRTADGSVRVAEVTKRDRFVGPVAERAEQPDGLFQAVNGGPLITQMVVGVAQGVPGLGLADPVGEIAVDLDRAFAVPQG